MQKTIFVVDDNDTNLSMAKEALRGHYRIMTLPSAERMFALLEKIMPDMILLDIEMPEMNGFEALKQLKSSKARADIPVIFLTGMHDVSMEVRGFQLGVVDFITKPFSEPVLLNRIKTHLNIDDLIRERTSQLHYKTEQLQTLQNAIIYSFADMIESRDKGTGGHIDRTATYIKILVNAMLESGAYADELARMDLDLFVSSARLHDVGKITIPDAILNKPGKLTPEEFEIMKTHASEGEHIIDQMAARTDDEEFLASAKLFAGYHHERWDGKGYPRGVQGMSIPLHGRVMAIVDVYDALVSVRPYKSSMPAEEAVKIIMESSGKQFDPLIADVFYGIRDKFEAVLLK